jgi:hypothetical protein
MFSRWLREPLVHFALVGAVLFGAYQWLNDGGQAPGSSGDIVVTAGRVRNLAETFARTWQRPPTPEEMNGLVEDYIREEVIYREALAMGLDRDDTIVRRRLRQKYEFISEDAIATAGEPTDEELAAYLQSHPEAYRVESRLTFRQVFLDPQRRGEQLDDDAAGLLDRLRSRGDRMDLASVGDSLMLESRYEDVTETDVARLFGEQFADALAEQPAGQWAGPITSGYGAHLIYLDARTPARAPALADVRDAVKRDFAQQKRQSLLESQYQTLRARYRITIEVPAPEARASSEGSGRAGG